VLIKKPVDIKSSEITPKELYLNRRQFIASASAVALTAGAALAGIDLAAAPRESLAGEKLKNLKKGPPAFDTTEKLNSFKDITSYNNFYELGVEKGDPAENAKDRRGRRRSEEAKNVGHRRHYEIELARRADLPFALRRSLVDGDTVGRIPPQRFDQSSGTYQ
jgi:hypothetical protein